MNGIHPIVALLAPRCLRNTGRIATMEISASETPQNASTVSSRETLRQWTRSGRVTRRKLPATGRRGNRRRSLLPPAALLLLAQPLEPLGQLLLGAPRDAGPVAGLTHLFREVL